MPIMFNSLLAEASLELSNVILIRHKDARATKGRSPYELWRDDRPAFEDYQSHQGFDGRSRFTRASKWASFVGLPDGKTMFVGVYDASYQGVLDHERVSPHTGTLDPAGGYDMYNLRVDEKFAEFDGRLFIDWGEGMRAWVQRADNQNKKITELRLKFEEDPFPGFLNFMEPLSKIAALPQGWTSVLKSSCGIYLLTCPKTREQYVGSVTGKEGFWQRWQNYSRTGHGGNVALRSRDPSDYQVSILEVAGSSATEVEILAMESRWKQKLQSREMGLNRN
ncbi:MAG: GIY-YIG nuclease family protein [Rhizomicrobium sp.]